jgi:ABC-2 type transport system ATP-binding protein
VDDTAHAHASHGDGGRPGADALSGRPRGEAAATTDAADSAGAPGVAVSARELGLDGPRGTVFADVSFEAPPGSLIALEGPSGSGRTCLLLSLTGRMKATSGHALVGAKRLPEQLAAVRRISALAAVPGVTDLEPALSVAEHLRERALLQRRFGGSLRNLLRPRRERTAASRARVDAALEAAGLDLEALPKGPRTRVRDLERLETLRLSVALALLGGPRLLAVDDVDFKLSESERAQAWSLLRSIASSGVTVLAVCSEAPEGAVTVRTDTRQERRQDRQDRRERERRQIPQQAAPHGESDATSDEEAGDAHAETGRA